MKKLEVFRTYHSRWKTKEANEDKITGEYDSAVTTYVKDKCLAGTYGRRRHSVRWNTLLQKDQNQREAAMEKYKYIFFHARSIRRE